MLREAQCFLKFLEAAKATGKRAPGYSLDELLRAIMAQPQLLLEKYAHHGLNFTKRSFGEPLQRLLLRTLGAKSTSS
jgi:hypothetical protein